MKVYPNSSLAQIGSISHPVFQYVEKRFWIWLDNGNAERREMYFGEDAINDRKGAIRQAIENAIEEADESGKPVSLPSFDIEAAFE